MKNNNSFSSKIKNVFKELSLVDLFLVFVVYLVLGRIFSNEQATTLSIIIYGLLQLLQERNGIKLRKVEDSMKEVEAFISGSYKYLLEIRMTIDKEKLLRTINPNMTDENIDLVKNGFSDSHYSLFSISSITWKKEFDSFFKLGKIQKNIRYIDASEDIYDVEGFSHGGAFFDRYSKKEHLMRLIYIDPNTKFQGIDANGLGDVLISLEETTISKNGLPKGVSERISKIPFYKFIKLCVDNRRDFYAQDIIGKLNGSGIPDDYTINQGESINSFIIESGPIKLEITMEFFNSEFDIPEKA